MPAHMREVRTCDRCRHFKRRCDLLRPSCTRCLEANIQCSFSTTALTSTTAGNPSGTSSSPKQDKLTVTPPNGGLMSPTASSESPGSNLPAASELEPESEASLDPPWTSGAHVSASAVGPRIVRKRKRNCLSCLRCHRLKVKCDKELPCRRCKASGNGRDCYYSYNKGPNGGKFPCPSAPVSIKSSDAKPGLSTWHAQHRVRGSSHWRDLMTKIGALSTLESPPLAAALEDVATNACLANFTLPGNFPFGTPGATKFFTRDATHRLIDSERGNCQLYIDKYIDLLDVVNPILDLDQFRQEIDDYWEDPQSVNLCWLSQFLMVLGLGCFASVEEPHRATELMMAAEASLMQTPFMFRPTLLTLRTLSLMVVAKQVCNATCWSIDSCWSLLGLLIRLAFIFGLPQERTDSDEQLLDPVERDTRRKLWLTILYLDIKVAMGAGMPPLTRPDELGSLQAMPEWGQPDNLHMVLWQSMPTVLTVLGHINSKKDQVAYPDVLRYSAQLRELMAHAQRVCCGQLQRITVDIFLRRCLMVLHRPFALHPEGPNMFPESYWSSLECSLALLVHYRELWCCENNQRFDLVGRAFVLDFFSATLTACVHVLRKDAPLSGASANGCEIPPRQIILETLKSCIDIWSGEQENSVCYRTGYKMLCAILALLPKTSSP